MCTIAAMRKRFEKLNTDLVAYQAMKASEQDISDLNLEQIYSGKTNKGEDIHPSYLEDPYWNDKGGLQAAQAYSDWKDEITPSSRRNPGIPNLFINGYYHSSRSVLVLPGGQIVHKTSAQFGDEISQKYANLDGLGGVFKKDFINNYLIYQVSDKMYQATGLKMKK